MISGKLSVIKDVHNSIDRYEVSIFNNIKALLANKRLNRIM